MNETSAAAPAVRAHHYDTRTLRLHTLEAGDPQAPLVICLHGFPDTADTWRTLLPALATAGYYAVAPHMRGYAPSAQAPDGDYRVPVLADDALALADALKRSRFAIVGHDWGSVAAHYLANAAPERVSAMVTAAVPHPRSLRPHPQQLWNSRYMLAFQWRGRAERRVRADNFAAIDELWRRWSPGWQYTPEDIAPIKTALAAPGGVQAALAYYRALPQAIGRALHDPKARAQLRTTFARTRVPTLAMAGIDDGCMRAAGFRDGESHYSGPFRLQLLADAGHFMHREQPDAFAESTLAWFALHAH
ncbi:MAG: alpha/beta hydrolase [Oceanococcaceae bacterium]